jgi:hypothetical protein
VKDGGGGVRSNSISGSNDPIGSKALVGNYPEPSLVFVGKARSLPIVKNNIRW